MSVSDIPAPDLAKLVLGYLAEEQLMTAYDEFLQSSPYLDALENEYDRIFMTSLKHIVSEYRAVRILVETCQPFSLRRKLLQCSNLLEMIKYLINNVDLQKCCAQSYTQSLHRIKRDSNSFEKAPPEHSKGNPSFLETTPLVDLPGYSAKKQVKVIEKYSEDRPAQVLNASESKSQQSISPADTNGHNKSHLDGSVQDACSLYIRNQNTSVLSRNQTSSAGHVSLKISPSDGDMIKSSAQRANVQRNSQHSEVTNYDATTTPLAPTPKSRNPNLREIKFTPKVNVPTLHHARDPLPTEHKKMQYLLQVTSKNSNNRKSDCNSNTVQSCKGNEQKVTIISDVKVDKSVANISNLLNGTSCRTAVANCNFTNDEIMAMPTIFIVPSTAPPLLSPISQQQETGQITTELITTNSTGIVPSLGPISIDITTASSTKTTHSTTQSLLTTAVETTSSLPKDSVIRVCKSSTPQGMPLVRKSSSTPRRTSHIRVLDFTTPRRILEETNNEHSEHHEIIVSSSPNLMICERGPTPDKNKSVNVPPKTLSNEITAKENKPVKRYNWDAELRALLANDGSQSPYVPKPKSATKPKSVKKKKAPSKDGKQQSPTKKVSRRSNVKKSPKVKITKVKNSKKKGKDKTEVPDISPQAEPVPIPVKPTINIVTEWNPSPPKEANKSDNKSNTEEQSDTPEMDRISLQNVIGAKLNISDLLETPYKQALYDIQMETPRFLQPDIPIDGPISEIKITDIPTPRFLSSALGQATPSSYNSRPTDYSSGGSYYKPDEHDYLPILENLETTQSKDEVKNKSKCSKSKNQEQTKKKSVRSSRPVRQCTKNVSYIDALAKSTEKKPETDTSYSDSSTVCDESKHTPPSDTSRTKSKLSLNTNSINKRTITPKIKRVSPKKFMKIKPRKQTPLSNRKVKRESGTPANRSISLKSVNTKGACSKGKTITTPAHTPAPTKSRRKSSTPRKLTAKKQKSASPDEGKPIAANVNLTKDMHRFIAPNASNDSDTEHLTLRWSDDGSRTSSERALNSAQSKPPQPSMSNEAEDINKIQEYIAKGSETPNIVIDEDGSGSLHMDLIRRGFDVETARSIERDLLDGSPAYNPVTITNPIETVSTLLNLENTSQNKLVTRQNNTEVSQVSCSGKSEKDHKSHSSDESTISANIQAVHEDREEEEEDEEIELSVHECNEDTNNHRTCSHSSPNEYTNKDKVTFKDTYSMEVCLEEETIRLRTGPLIDLFSEEPIEDIQVNNISVTETEAAVNSIAIIDKLYTPLKEQRSAIQAQCIEIFDSTLTSLDTPLKSPVRDNVTIAEVILEVEKVNTDDMPKPSKKRKRIRSDSCSDESLNEHKKNKREARYIPNIQNIDIESVLSKLHGP